MVSPSPPSVLGSTPWETGPAKEGLGGLVWTSPNSRVDQMALMASCRPRAAGGMKNHSTLAWHPWGPTACPHTPHRGPKWGSLQEGEAQAGRAYLSALAWLRPLLPGHPPCLPTDSASRPRSCHPHVNPEGNWGSGGLWLPKDTPSVEGADFRPELWSVRLQWSHTLFNSPAVSQD